MNKALLSAIDMWTALFEARAHFYPDFPHEYWTWLQDRHNPCELMPWHGKTTVVLVFDEEHDLPPVDSNMRKPVEWLIERFSVCTDGHPFVIK
jgi:hypothetical protein